MPRSNEMRDRVPGELVIERLMQLQSAAKPRSFLSRLFGFTPLLPESHPWYQGALGEIAVGRILARLPATWTSFHAVPIGTSDSDVDHIVAGAGGIFTINTKHHRGRSVWIDDRTMRVSGHIQPYIPYAEHEADRVARLLRSRMTLLTPVEPVIVLVDPKQITVRKRPARVTVVEAKHLRHWLMKRPVILVPADLDAIVAMLDDRAAWRERDPSDPGLMLTFERLHRDVRSARTRRRLWVLGLFASLGAVAYAALPLLSEVFVVVTASLIG